MPLRQLATYCQILYSATKFHFTSIQQVHFNITFSSNFTFSNCSPSTKIFTHVLSLIHYTCPDINSVYLTKIIVGVRRKCHEACNSEIFLCLLRALRPLTQAQYNHAVSCFQVVPSVMVKEKFSKKLKHQKKFRCLYFKSSSFRIFWKLQTF